MAAPALWAAMWCGRLPRPARACGWRCARPELAGHLQPLGGVGQIMAVQANVRYPDSLRAPAEGADAVINLVGILAPSGKQTFQGGAGRGRPPCRRGRPRGRSEGLRCTSPRSAPIADSPSVYARSKAAGEAGGPRNLPGAVILRPSVVFGPEDEFFNRFAALARLSPGSAADRRRQTKFQPVFVGDVAKAVLAALTGKARAGAALRARRTGDPDDERSDGARARLHHAQAMARALPFPLAKLQGAILQLLPNPPLTLDQVRLLRKDNVVSEEAKRDRRTLEGLGIEPVRGRGRGAGLSRAISPEGPVLRLPAEPAQA